MKNLTKWYDRSKYMGIGVDSVLTLKDVCKVLDASVLTGEDSLEMPVLSACGSDLMSDVLAFTKERTLLLTGLTNLQVIRTADISDLSAIVFVRGKIPQPDLIAAAKERDIPLLITNHPMYEACGLLYQKGLRGCSSQPVANYG